MQPLDFNPEKLKTGATAVYTAMDVGADGVDVPADTLTQPDDGARALELAPLSDYADAP